MDSLLVGLCNTVSFVLDHDVTVKGETACNVQRKVNEDLFWDATLIKKYKNKPKKNPNKSPKQKTRKSPAVALVQLLSLTSSKENSGVLHKYYSFTHF